MPITPVNQSYIYRDPAGRAVEAQGVVASDGPVYVRPDGRIAAAVGVRYVDDITGSVRGVFDAPDEPYLGADGRYLDPLPVFETADPSYVGAGGRRLATLTVSDVSGGGPTFVPSLDFSDARNSQYIGQVV